MSETEKAGKKERERERSREREREREREGESRPEKNTAEPFGAVIVTGLFPSAAVS